MMPWTQSWDTARTGGRRVGLHGQRGRAAVVGHGAKTPYHAIAPIVGRCAHQRAPRWPAGDARTRAQRRTWYKGAL